MRASTKTTFLISALSSLLICFTGAGCGSSSSTAGGAGKGGGGTTGGAGTGSAGTTGGAGTGVAGTTGSAGTTGGAGTTGSAGTTGADAGTDAPATDGGTDVSATDAKDAAVAETGSDVTNATDTAVADTAGADTAVNACTNVALPAAVFAHYLTAAAPAPAGGDLVAGTYSLTELNHYGSATASTGNDPIRLGLILTATTVEWASQNKNEAVMRSSYTYTKGTNKLVLTNVCPTAGAGDMPGYTATATTLKVYLDAEYVLTKQ